MLHGGKAWVSGNGDENGFPVIFLHMKKKGAASLFSATASFFIRSDLLGATCKKHTIEKHFYFNIMEKNKH